MPKNPFKFPSFPPGAKKKFMKRCETVPIDSVPTLIGELEHLFSELMERAQQSDQTNTALAERIFDESKYLLGRYEEFDPKQQGLIIGAVRYFVLEDDAMPDEDCRLGCSN